MNEENRTEPTGNGNSADIPALKKDSTGKIVAIATGMTLLGIVGAMAVAATLYFELRNERAKNQDAATELDTHTANIVDEVNNQRQEAYNQGIEETVSLREQQAEMRCAQAGMRFLEGQQKRLDLVTHLTSEELEPLSAEETEARAAEIRAAFTEASALLNQAIGLTLDDGTEATCLELLADVENARDALDTFTRSMRLNMENTDRRRIESAERAGRLRACVTDASELRDSLVSALLGETTTEVTRLFGSALASVDSAIALDPEHRPALLLKYKLLMAFAHYCIEQGKPASAVVFTGLAKPVRDSLLMEYLGEDGFDREPHEVFEECLARFEEELPHRLTEGESALWEGSPPTPEGIEDRAMEILWSHDLFLRAYYAAEQALGEAYRNQEAWLAVRDRTLEAFQVIEQSGHHFDDVKEARLLALAEQAMIMADYCGTLKDFNDAAASLERFDPGSYTDNEEARNTGLIRIREIEIRFDGWMEAFAEIRYRLGETTHWTPGGATHNMIFREIGDQFDRIETWRPRVLLWRLALTTEPEHRFQVLELLESIDALDEGLTAELADLRSRQTPPEDTPDTPDTPDEVPDMPDTPEDPEAPENPADTPTDEPSGEGD